MEFYSSIEEEQDLAEWLAGKTDLLGGEGDEAPPADNVVEFPSGDEAVS
jgi:hypothetical protein